MALGLPSVNHQVGWDLTGNKRWIGGVAGPSQGPVIEWGMLVMILAISSWRLGKSGLAPLRAYQWFLLCLCLLPVGDLSTIGIMACLLGLGWRNRRVLSPSHYNAGQIAAGVGLGLCLVAWFADFTSLRFMRPPTNVSGGPRAFDALVWSQDRVAGILPRPWMVSLPAWAYQATLLVLGLWLATQAPRLALRVDQLQARGTLEAPAAEPAVAGLTNGIAGLAGHFSGTTLDSSTSRGVFSTRRSMRYHHLHNAQYPDCSRHAARRRFLLLLVMGVLLVPPQAAAQSDMSGLNGVANGVLAALEVGIPDLRLELTKPVRAVLSWPVHVSVRRFFADPPDENSVVWPSIFVEPQIRLGEREYRSLIGTRWTFNWHLLGLLTEAGGLMATDGAGGFVGAGLQPLMKTMAENYYMSLGLFALVYRHIWTQHEHRNEISLDILYMQF